MNELSELEQQIKHKIAQIKHEMEETDDRAITDRNNRLVFPANAKISYQLRATNILSAD
jgi:hypothetical protein